MSKNLTEIPTPVLFNWLESLFSANNTIVQIQNSMHSIVQSKEVFIKPSFIQKKDLEINNKIQFNNEAIALIEKELKKRVKKKFPSICVLSDIDMLSKSINDEVEKENKSSKGLTKT